MGCKHIQGATWFLGPSRYVSLCTFDGTILNRGYGTPKNLCISLFLPTIFGPIYYGPPQYYVLLLHVLPFIMYYWYVLSCIAMYCYVLLCIAMYYYVLLCRSEIERFT